MERVAAGHRFLSVVREPVVGMVVLAGRQLQRYLVVVRVEARFKRAR
ncbi:hypothetical protein [Limnochorda pilosa]|nr:hypothetical protein [Limnochorda pilosa]